MRRGVALIVCTLFVACRPAAEPPAARIAVTRPAGAWTGAGNQTLGFTSDSGRLRIAWKTQRSGSAQGDFRLTLHSAVSGRLLHDIATHRGDGEAVVEVEDDPRPYTLMVESSAVQWTISVEETIAVPPPAPPR